MCHFRKWTNCQCWRDRLNAAIISLTTCWPLWRHSRTGWANSKKLSRQFIWKLVTFKGDTKVSFQWRSFCPLDFSFGGGGGAGVNETSTMFSKRKAVKRGKIQTFFLWKPKYFGLFYSESKFHNIQRTYSFVCVLVSTVNPWVMWTVRSRTKPVCVEGNSSLPWHKTDIEKTLSALDHVIEYYHVAEEVEPAIREGYSHFVNSNIFPFCLFFCLFEFDIFKLSDQRIHWPMQPWRRSRKLHRMHAAAEESCPVLQQEQSRQSRDVSSGKFSLALFSGPDMLKN